MDKFTTALMSIVMFTLVVVLLAMLVGGARSTGRAMQEEDMLRDITLFGKFQAMDGELYTCERVENNDD